MTHLETVIPWPQMTLPGPWCFRNTPCSCCFFYTGNNKTQNCSSTKLKLQMVNSHHRIFFCKQRAYLWEPVKWFKGCIHNSWILKKQKPVLSIVWKLETYYLLVTLWFIEITSDIYHIIYGICAQVLWYQLESCLWCVCEFKGKPDLKTLHFSCEIVDYFK